MDFGGGHNKPSTSRLFENDVDPPPGNNDPATSTSKRQRSTEDYQDQLLLKQPPQTRRMMGMGLGLGFPAGSSSSGVASDRSSPLFSSSNDLAARRVAGLVSPPKLIGRDTSSSSISDSSSNPKGSGSAMPSVRADSEEIEIESHDEAGFVVQSKSKSKSISTLKKSPEVGGEGSSSSTPVAVAGSRSSSNDWTYTVEKDDVDEHELGHRLSYLQMRGYDQALLDVMDEGILEESSEAYSSASELGHTEQVEIQYAGVEVSYDPRDGPLFASQPAVVTPERL